MTETYTLDLLHVPDRQAVSDQLTMGPTLMFAG